MSVRFFSWYWSRFRLQLWAMPSDSKKLLISFTTALSNVTPFVRLNDDMAKQYTSRKARNGMRKFPYRILVILCGELSYSDTPSADFSPGGCGGLHYVKSPEKNRSQGAPYRKPLILKDFGAPGHSAQLLETFSGDRSEHSGHDEAHRGSGGNSKNIKDLRDFLDSFGFLSPRSGDGPAAGWFL